MKYKNDVSFLVDKTLSLYEHQSSYNPNMPLRGFLYYADLYRKLIHRSERLYSKHLLKIPRPHYIVFYNGSEKDLEEKRRTLRLSDAFETDTGAGEYEWTATMININSGKNQSIMDSCHVLYEYAVFVAKIKRYRESMELKEAIDLAVRECIEENILRDFLEQHRREVCDMCLTEFDEKKYEDVLREEGREEGLAEGLEKGLEKGLAKGRKIEVFVSVQEGDYGVVRGAQKLNLSVEEFEKEMSAAGYQIPVEI